MAPSTTSGGLSGSRLSLNQINNYERTKRVNVFVGRFDQNDLHLQLGVFPELAKYFLPTWKQELLEKKGVCMTAYADKDANETEKTCVRFVIQWIEQGGSDCTGIRAIYYPKHDVQILRTLRALVKGLQIGLLLERIDKDLTPIANAATRRAQKAADFDTTKDEQDGKPVFCELCRNQDHWDRRCLYAASYKGRCFKCRGVNHKSETCTAKPDLSPLEVAGSFDASKTVREERSMLWALKQARLAASRAGLPKKAPLPALASISAQELTINPISNLAPNTALISSNQASSVTLAPASDLDIVSKTQASKPEPLLALKVAGTRLEEASFEHVWQPTRTTTTPKNQIGKLKSMQLETQFFRVEVIDGVEWLAIKAEGRILRVQFEANVAIK